MLCLGKRTHRPGRATDPGRCGKVVLGGEAGGGCEATEKPSDPGGDNRPGDCVGRKALARKSGNKYKVVNRRLGDRVLALQERLPELL